MVTVRSAVRRRKIPSSSVRLAVWRVATTISPVMAAWVAKLKKLTIAPAIRSCTGFVPDKGSRLHAGRRDLRGLEPHGVERAPDQAGSLGILDERRHRRERSRLVLLDRDRGGRVEEAAVEHARAGERLDEAADRLARERDGIDLAGAHQRDAFVRALDGDRRGVGCGAHGGAEGRGALDAGNAHPGAVDLLDDPDRGA